MEVIYSICSKLAGGGIGDTAYQAVRGIYRHGYLKQVIARGSGKIEIEKSKVRKVWYPKRMKLSYMPAWRWYGLESLYFDSRVAAILKRTGCDVFHGWNGKCLRSLQEAKRQGAITVVERASSHILTQMKLVLEEYETYGIKDEPDPPGAIARCLEEYETADYITVPSQFVYDSFLENGFERDKLLLLSFGVDAERFRPVRKEDNVFRLLFVGRLTLRKGIQYLLEAWSKLDLKNAQLLLVGSLDKNLRPLIERYREKKNIELSGFLRNPVKVFNSASAFVCPSIEEGSALVTYEAMACGLPVIATVNSGSLVRDGKEGFLIPIRDVEVLKERIAFLYENEEKRREMGKASRERVSNYTWDGYGDKLVKAYEKILS
jgi:glycosyltransferase involved in cell wall biosynthesis